MTALRISNLFKTLTEYVLKNIIKGINEIFLVGIGYSSNENHKIKVNFEFESYELK